MPEPVVTRRVPVPRHRLVDRPRLLAGLPPRPDSRPRLVLIAAPAGFGKTTLLTQWLAEASKDVAGPVVAWLRVVPADADPGRFLSDLVDAVRAAHPALAVRADDLLAAEPGGPPEAVLATLVEDLARCSAPVVLALDDVHLADSPENTAALAFLVESLPPRVCVAITTRAEPALPLARWRARGELVEVRAADLRFTAGEAGSFFAEVMGLRLAQDVVATLGRRTEGWAVGLHLAGLSIRDRLGRAGAEASGARSAQTAALVEEFGGSHRMVLDYLIEEVLEAQPEQVRDFLMQTSVLTELTAGACDALTGRGDGLHMLETLERANLFVDALDERRIRYRYHQLFADALRTRLARRHPDRLVELHRAAARWYAGQGLFADAVAHALDGEQPHHAAELVEETVRELRRSRRDRLLRGWLQRLPDQVIASRPLLSTYQAWARLVDGDPVGARRWLEHAEHPVAAAGEPPGQPRTSGRDDRPDAPAPLPGTSRADEIAAVPAMIRVYRASIAQAEGDLAGTLRHARAALALAPEGDHLTRGAAGGFLGLAAWAAGEPEQATTIFTAATEHLRAAGSISDLLGSAVVLAGIWLSRGRPDRARAQYEQALATAGRRAGPPVAPVGDLHAGLAVLECERGDLDSAAAHLGMADDLGDNASLPEHRHRREIARAALCRAEGDLPGALAALDRAADLYRVTFLPEPQPVAALRARVLIAAGRLSEARDWARSVVDREGSTAGPDQGPGEYEMLTVVRSELAWYHRTGDTGEADLRRWVDVLDRTATEAGAAGRRGVVLDTGLVRALVLDATGAREAAVEALAGVLEEAVPVGYRQVFEDEGEPMVRLAAALANRPGSPGARFAAALVPRPAPGAPGRPVEGRPEVVEALSEREHEVLRWLSGDLSGPQIARRMFISLNTFRTHTKSIYLKLGVGSRRAAVRRAGELGLLAGPGPERGADPPTLPLTR